MRLALCDDECEQLVRTEELLRRYGALHPDLELTAEAFSSGSALLEHLRSRGIFDIYLLDVIMPGENGIQLGMSIREMDRGGNIIYLTTSPDFAVESYRAKASDYLLKPLEKGRLFRALDEVAERWARERRDFAAIKTREGLRRVSLSAVVYGELTGRRVQYHMADGSLIEGMSLRDSFQNAVRPLLEHRRFVLCATSFFVNLSFVEMIEASGLRLVGGGTLPLSRSLRSEVTGRWLDYHLEHGGGR